MVLKLTWSAPLGWDGGLPKEQSILSIFLSSIPAIVARITIFLRRDFPMIWRIIKDFKSDIVFSAGFDHDIDSYYI